MGSNKLSHDPAHLKMMRDKLTFDQRASAETIKRVQARIERAEARLAKLREKLERLQHRREVMLQKHDAQGAAATLAANLSTDRLQAVLADLLNDKAGRIKLVRALEKAVKP